ncbi:MAG: choice-of-anchor Q domain-containing protein [Candidatus Hydrogenedentota bacterium]
METRFAHRLDTILVLALLLTSATAPAAMAATYYVANDGSDENSGLTAEEPWATLIQVNTVQLLPGDTVLFKRGDTWRGQLGAQSGSAEEGFITYGAYGEGPKPLLLGSIAKDAPEDWRDEGGTIWCAGGIDTAEKSNPVNLTTNPGFDENTSAWSLHTEHGAEVSHGRDTEHFETGPGAYRIACQASGSEPHHIQFYTSGIPIERGAIYRLTLTVRATEPFEMYQPAIMKSGAPWSRYAHPRNPRNIAVTTEWTAHTLMYGAIETAEDGRINFVLGGCLPAGVTLYLDSIRLERLGGGLIPRDVGNIIYDHGPQCGIKVWNRADLDQQDEYWYDEDDFALYLCSDANPASRFDSIECAIRDHIISQNGTRYVIYENLACMYGAAHGIGGGNTHHIIVRDCDFGYIGGGDQRGGEHTVRYGNGVEFWGPAHDNLVERCRFWEVYDAAMTHQSHNMDAAQYNIVYQNNLVWNCEYSFEYWNRPETATTHHIWFVNNTCINAGHGWGHTQRPDPSGRHLCFYNSPAEQSEFHVSNNIFYEAKTNAFYAPTWPLEQVKSLIMDNNCWYQAEGTMIALKDHPFSMAEFDEYRELTGLEPNSIVAKPGLVDMEAHDFHLRPDSPCIDAAKVVEALFPRLADFEGTSIPQGNAPDIGAYEFDGPEK